MFDGFRSLLGDILPTPRLKADANGKLQREVTRIVVFGRHPNPTSDYYFAARLSASGMPEHQFADIRGGDFRSVNPDGAFIILCRYTSLATIRWLKLNQHKLAGVGLFLDDDIRAVVTGRDADISYRFFLFFRALLPLPMLNKHLDVVWASTPELADKLKGATPIILPPAPPLALWDFPHSDPLPSNPITIAYHATGVHVEEHSFLAPVIEEVLAARPHARFEVFAGRKALRYWQNMERVTIRKPLSWPDYLAEASVRRIDIMLVPLTPSPVNDCRSPTKRIDVARTGAAGIFSISHAYGKSEGDGEILLPYDRNLWRNAILELVDNPKMRWNAANATRAKVSVMTKAAEAGLDLPRSYRDIAEIIAPAAK